MKQQPDLEAAMHSPQAQTLLRNKQALESVVKSGEAQRLMDALNQSSGGTLKRAAQSAMKGDSAQLVRLVEGIMKDPKNAKLMEELNRKVQP